MHKKRKKLLGSDDLERLREFIEDLDLVPLAIYPESVRPLVLQYLDDLEKDKIPFDNEIERVSVNIYLRQHRRKKKQITVDDLKLELDYNVL